MGTKGLVYEPPAIRVSWAPHGTDAYYVGPALKHYWCLHFYMPGTRRYCVLDTWQLYPTHWSFPYTIGFGVYGQCWGFNGGGWLYRVRFFIA